VNCDDTTLSLGVYLVGALDAQERTAVEEHLSDCPTCQAELAELAALPSMLEKLTIDDFPLEPLVAPDGLFDRVAARAREEQDAHQSRRVARYRRLTAVAAAAVLVVGAGVGSLIAFGGGHHQSTPNTFSHSQGGITMQVVLASQATGTGLRVTVSGLPRNEHCSLIAIASDGRRDIAGRWDATYSGWAQETGSTRIPQSQLSHLVLLGTNGQQLDTVDV
jgi:predicted anti-sigma-YlaC factor YlaD